MKIQRSVASTLLLPLLALIVFSGITSCKRDGEVLAEYDGGKIVRKDLRNLASLLRQGDEHPTMSVDEQNMTLKELALIQIASLEAVKEGMEKSNEFAKEALLLEETSAMAAYDHYFQSKKSDLKFEMMDIQFLFLSGLSPDGKQKMDRNEEADELLKKLNSGIPSEEIDQIVADKTENPRYKLLSGYLDPHCISCPNDPIPFLTSGLKKAENGKFIKASDGRGIWIARKNRQYHLKSDELADTFLKFQSKITERLKKAINEKGGDPKVVERRLKQLPDEKARKNYAEQQAGRQIQSALRNVRQEEVEKRKKELNFQENEAVLSQLMKSSTPPADTALLFSLNGKPYTYGTLVQPFRQRGLDIPMSDFARYLNFYAPYILLADIPAFKEAQKSDFYKLVYNLRKNQILTRLYLQKHLPKVEVMPQDIAQWYTLRKNNEYKGKSLAQVQEAIKKQLLSNKQSESAKEFREMLLNKHKLKIYRDRLKPGEI